MICPKCRKALSEVENFCPGCGDDLRGLTPLSDTLSGPWSGRVIDGRYLLLEKLGEGGMGSVFKVEHVRMGKVLALKLLRPDIALDKKLRARFLQEARVVSRLSHPNTIQVFDCGELEDGSMYIAMEFLAGRDLAWLLRNRGPFGEEQAVTVGVQVLSSLSEAHEQGIVHRDIKPANVMLVKRKERDDLVKVLDFGIAKLNEAEGRKHITGVADLIGTPAYMSPEQAQGEKLDARSDLYSVGAMLFELVTGRGVFVGPTPMSVVTKHLNEPPPRVVDVAPGRPVSPAFEQVLRKALGKNPEERHVDADQMRAALEKVRRELGALAHDLTPLPEDSPLQMASRQDFDRFERKLRIRRVLAPMLALALLGGAAAGGVFYYRSRGQAPFLTAEQEPNDQPFEANRIALGKAVSGAIGPGKQAERSDVDLYVLEAPPGPLSVELTAVANLNLSVLLSWHEAGEGGERRRTLFLDDGGPGLPERVDGLSFPGGELRVHVEEQSHFTEPIRPPLEKSALEYRLTVAALPAEGVVEREPNDLLEEAQRVSVEKSLTGFAGAPMGYPPPDARVRPAAPYLSAADFFVVGEETEQVHALVVPPPGGKLWVVDAFQWETWERKRSSPEGAKATPPEPVPAEERPRLLRLLPISKGGAGVRVQAGERTVAGARYHLAFLTSGSNGLAPAIDLAKKLKEEGRLEERQAALELVAKSFPTSPQLEEIRLALTAPAKDAPPPQP